MKITFGICTSYEDPDRLRTVVNQLQCLRESDGEVIVAGPEYGSWLPQKKNKIAQVAKHEVIVLMHDYFVFHPLWFVSYNTFGYNWDVCSNPQFLINGDRHFTDWVLWDHPKYPRYTSVEYMNYDLTKYQYISGGYFLVKKQFLLDNPLNENLVPGDPEDVEWSLRIRNKATIACNPAALVIHNKTHRDAGRWGFPFVQPTHYDYESYKKVIGYD